MKKLIEPRAKTRLEGRSAPSLPCWIAALLLVAAFAPAPLPSLSANAEPVVGKAVTVPGFWDPRRRPERPDLSRVPLLRFMTEVDYPPFNFAGTDGNPVGFNVDLARAICEELRVSCTVQMRRFDTLLDALGDNRGDAAIASIAVNAETRRRADFTDPYYRPVARFVALRDAGFVNLEPERVEGKKIGVVAGTAHEQYLRALFTEAEIRPFGAADQALEALRQHEVDLVFGDGFGLAFWLNGTDSAGCCEFAGGGFTESRFFGDGVGIAVKPGNDAVRQGINWALFRLWEKGRFADLWLRYFPINPY